MLIVLLVCTPCGFVVLYKSDLLLFVYTKLQVCHPWGVVSLSITIRMDPGTYQSWLPDSCGGIQVFGCIQSICYKVVNNNY